MAHHEFIEIGGQIGVGFLTNRRGKLANIGRRAMAGTGRCISGGRWCSCVHGWGLSGAQLACGCKQ